MKPISRPLTTVLTVQADVSPNGRILGIGTGCLTVLQPGPVFPGLSLHMVVESDDDHVVTEDDTVPFCSSN